MAYIFDNGNGLIGRTFKEFRPYISDAFQVAMDALLQAVRIIDQNGTLNRKWTWNSCGLS